MANVKTCSKCGKVGLDQYDFLVYWHDQNGKYYYWGWCNECEKERYKNYRKKNPEKRKETVKNWAQSHPDYNKEYYRNWYQNNREKILEHNKQWKQNNKDKVNVGNAKRRAAKRNQSPPLTKNEQAKVDLYYKVSDDLGPLWHVDHTIPLSKGGLHHPDNIKVVTKAYNLEKGDKLDFREPTPLEVRRIK